MLFKEPTLTITISIADTEGDKRPSLLSQLRNFAPMNEVCGTVAVFQTNQDCCRQFCELPPLREGEGDHFRIFCKASRRIRVWEVRCE